MKTNYLCKNGWRVVFAAALLSSVIFFGCKNNGSDDTNNTENNYGYDWRGLQKSLSDTIAKYEKNPVTKYSYDFKEYDGETLQIEIHSDLDKENCNIYKKSTFSENGTPSEIEVYNYVKTSETPSSIYAIKYGESKEYFEDSSASVDEAKLMWQVNNESDFDIAKELKNALLYVAQYPKNIESTGSGQTYTVKYTEKSSSKTTVYEYEVENNVLKKRAVSESDSVSKTSYRYVITYNWTEPSVKIVDNLNGWKKIADDEDVFFQITSSTGSSPARVTYLYKSIGADGNEIMLSSFLAYPTEKEPDSVFIGCHVTITSDSDCPSVNKGNSIGETFMFINSHLNSLVVIPDYEGYGITKNKVHPYLVRDLTAKQVVDAVKAGIAVYKKQTGKKFSPVRGTVAAGYSQGGAVAMSVHRYIETNNLTDTFKFKGSVCGDGPYDEMATMGNYISTNKLAMPVALAMVIQGLCLSDSGLKGTYTVEHFFTEDFINSRIFDWINAKDYSQSKLEKYSNDSGNNLGYDSESGTFATNKILKPEIIKCLNGDTSGVSDEIIAMANALKAAAVANSVVADGWTPSKPVFCVHCKEDEVVPFANYTSAKNKLGSNFRGIKTTYSKPLTGSTGSKHSDMGTNFFFSSHMPERTLVNALFDGSWTSYEAETEWE